MQGSSSAPLLLAPRRQSVTLDRRKSSLDIGFVDETAVKPLTSRVTMSALRISDSSDVEMVPAYMASPEQIVAPRLRHWNQAALIRWAKEREHYERRLRERCASTGESYDAIAVSVKGSVDAHLLDNLATYVLGKTLDSLTDEDVSAEILRRCRSVKNAHLPDLEALFAEKLKMDIHEDDVEARILKFFTDFNTIVEDHGLQSVMGRQSSNDQDAVVRTKNRTKILIDNLAPAMLKKEINRLAPTGLSFRASSCAAFVTPTSLTKTLASPISVQVVGGGTFECREGATLDIQVRIAAGPVNIRAVDFLILDEDENEFILGKDVLSSLGIDVSLMIEKVAENGQDDPNEDDEVHAISLEFNDVWRTKLGMDPPADVESLCVSFRAMPNLKGAAERVAGARYFACFDYFKGFWQCSLHPGCQEQFSFNQMNKVYQPMLWDNLLVWIDDMVVFAHTRAVFVSKSVVDFSRLAAPLYAILDAALAGKGRAKRVAAGVSVTWSPEALVQYEAFLRGLRASAQLSFPIPDATACVFTDASDVGWAVAATQAVTEKEAYPIIRACVTLEFALARERGFRLYCDHANLVHIFSPHQSIKKHIRGKPQRWPLHLVPYRYEIEHISGERNVFADICVFPTAVEIVKYQRAARNRPADMPADGSPLKVEGKIWLPPDAEQLVNRVFIVAHCGYRGHRGTKVMLNAIQAEFALDGMQRKVDAFVRKCLLCRHVKGNLIEQHEWKTEGFATAHNETLLMDYLYLGESMSGAKYCLVRKDAFSHFCELVASDTASSRVAADSTLARYMRFGLPKFLTTDNGTRFRNEVVARAKLDVRNWDVVLPVVQACVNHSAVPSLGNKCPMEIFTGLTPPPILRTVVVQRGKTTEAVDMRPEAAQEVLDFDEFVVLMRTLYAPKSNVYYFR
ncbi:hypothetical protein PybrP1_002807 [[Pythium] brassicae (nom. inval.)]|nr:hypothetical protein PybrP1_002807 [[Pythium] brassicae (nom. inval.)]